MRHAKSEKPKKSFIKRWFPCRGDRPSTVVLKILTLVCLLVFWFPPGCYWMKWC